MTPYPCKVHYTAEDLVEIIRILRDPDAGCPWNKVQTHASIRMNFLEEAYEAVDALDLDDPELLCEELGDVLMQTVFHAEMEEETGRFTWQDVCDGVCRKLIFRHPHIFGAQPGLEGINDWDALKNKEKGRTTLAGDLESVPKAMPALMRAAKLKSGPSAAWGRRPRSRTPPPKPRRRLPPAARMPRRRWDACCSRPSALPARRALTRSRPCSAGMSSSCARPPGRTPNNKPVKKPARRGAKTAAPPRMPFCR